MNDSDQIVKLINEAIARLSEREVLIISNRYGLKEKAVSLAEIGRDLKLSRERVRQLETEIKRKLKKIISQKSEEIKGAIKPYPIVPRSLGSGEFKKLDQIDKNYYKLFYDVLPDYELVKKHQKLNASWRHLSKTIDLLIDDLAQIKEKLDKFDTLNSKKLARIINYSVDELVLLVEAASELHLASDGQVGYTGNRLVNPKTIPDKMLYVLKHMNKPMHFKDLAHQIGQNYKDGKKINPATVHNELIANDRFVLIGRGTYALKDWGYKPGSVSELIYELIEMTGPKTHKEIIDFISKQRRIRKNTIVINIKGEKRIAKNLQGEYYIVRD